MSIVQWIISEGVSVLNVAGNAMPEIENDVETCLDMVFTLVLSMDVS